MGEDELAAIEALAEAATCGPWVPVQHELTLTERGREQFPAGLPASNCWAVVTAYDHPQLHGPDDITRTGHHIWETPEYTSAVRAEDAAFIAAAREAVPVLVAEVRRLRAEVAALEASVEALRRHWEAERAEVARRRAVEAAARAVSDGVDSAETAEANLLRALDAAIDRLDAARA